MHIVYVSDGKAGHRSQAVGLFKALQRQDVEQVSFEEISIDQLPILSLLTALFKQKNLLLSRSPDYILGVGSHTQLRVVLLGKIYSQAKTVILMKPNYPLTWFNHVIIPEHDGIAENGNVILTQGALNPIVNEQRHQQNRILIALGGSSKRHQWNDTKVLNSIQQIVNLNPHAELILTTSRRTPKEFLENLKQQSYSSKLNIFPVDQTPQGWIFEEMQKAEGVWVTEDSVSMIFEALTAGCRVGVIEIDRLKSDRITQLLDQLLVNFKIEQQGIKLLNLKLDEATRVADILMKKRDA